MDNLEFTPALPTSVRSCMVHSSYFSFHVSDFILWQRESCLCKIFIWSSQFPFVTAFTPFRLWHSSPSPHTHPPPPQTPITPHRVTAPTFLSSAELCGKGRQKKKVRTLSKKYFSFHVYAFMCLCLCTLCLYLLLICLLLDGWAYLGEHAHQVRIIYSESGWRAGGICHWYWWIDRCFRHRKVQSLPLKAQWRSQWGLPIIKTNRPKAQRSTVSGQSWDLLYIIFGKLPF